MSFLDFHGAIYLLALIQDYVLFLRAISTSQYPNTPNTAATAWVNLGFNLSLRLQIISVWQFDSSSLSMFRAASFMRWPISLDGSHCVASWCKVVFAGCRVDILCLSSGELPRRGVLLLC
jgi:hypothetical protein